MKKLLSGSIEANCRLQMSELYLPKHVTNEWNIAVGEVTTSVTDGKRRNSEHSGSPVNTSQYLRVLLLLPSYLILISLDVIRTMLFGMPSTVSNYALQCIAFLFIGYVLSLFIPGWLGAMGLMLDDSILFMRISSIFTYSTVTDEIVVLGLSILSIVLLDRLVRGCWTKWEIILFVAFVNTVSVLSSAICLRIFFPNSFMLLCGSSALVSAASVVSFQFDKERILLGYGSIGLKSSHGFFVILGLYFFFALVHLIRWSSFLLYVNGFFFSWLYLRFFQHHPQRKRGDHRAGFSLAKFFPGPLERWVALLSNLVYMGLLRTKLCPGIERQSEIVSTASFAVDIPGLTTDADRHRRIALKALNERLFTKQDDPMEWPNLEDANSTAAAVAGPVTSTVEIPLGLHINALASEDPSPSTIDLTRTPSPQQVVVQLPSEPAPNP